MYKVAIIDDDMIIRKGLTHTIPWAELGCRVVGTASNGNKGLELIAAERPQIIITDIRMPFMDGLQMSQIVREQYPESKVIFLTGYGEFEYVQEALKLRVFDYILKPVDSKHLCEKITEIKRELEKEYTLQRQIKEGLPYLRGTYLKKLLIGEASAVGTEGERESLGIHLEDSQVAVLIVKIDDYHSGAILTRYKEKELYHFCMLNICEELLRQYFHGYIYFENDDRMVMFINHDVPKSELQAKVGSFAEKLRTTIELYLKSTVTVGQGNVYQGLESLSEAYADADSVLNLRLVRGKNRVLTTHDRLEGSEETVNTTEIRERQDLLVAKAKMGLLEETYEVIFEIEQELVHSGIDSLEQAQFIGVETIAFLFQEMKEWREHYEERISEAYKSIFKAEIIEDIFEVLRGLFGDLIGFMKSKKMNTRKKTVELAVEYMNGRYSDHELTLNEVAKEVFVSATYLSLLFKRELKTNFNKVLLDIRMTKAIELFTQEDYKSFEISEKVGFNNPQYFSVCFKKYTGYSPSEYRKR
ncbi:response regulator [Paenibacillus hexagrammi]|uniref:Response regulator n=1 Tax=Paenibacillus hexagrammi TaxID=2908839 RepID=A0ABY3SF68_9BACL|nr:response regulator [Paenibacillus sp. YPD9-1]UJF32639.1 response regulator [Paenibacillus sp. YPD9-1]